MSTVASVSSKAKRTSSSSESNEFLAEGLDVQMLKQLLDGIKEQYDRVMFVADPDVGLKAEMMSAAHVLFLTIHINKSAFRTFRCPRPTCIHFRITHMLSLLKCALKGDSISLSAQTGQPDFLYLDIVSPDGSRHVHFQLSMIDITEEGFTIPPYENDYVVRIPSEMFAKTLSSIREQSDICRFRVTDGRAEGTVSSVAFGTSNMESGDLDVRLYEPVPRDGGESEGSDGAAGAEDGGDVTEEKALGEDGGAAASQKRSRKRTRVDTRTHAGTVGDKEHVRIHFSDKASSSYELYYPMNYFAYTSKLSSFAPAVTIAFQENLPISVKYEHELGHASVVFYLAPRISDE